MLKVIAVVAVLCLGSFVACDRGKDRRPGHGYGQAASPCDNTTNVQTFLTNYQTLIQQLAGNSSFTQWLQIHAQEVAYINASTTTFVQANCTAFLTALSTARSADQTLLGQSMNLLRSVDNRVRQIAPYGVRSPSSDNSGEKYRYKRSLEANL